MLSYFKEVKCFQKNEEEDKEYEEFNACKNKFVLFINLLIDSYQSEGEQFLFQMWKSLRSCLVFKISVDKTLLSLKHECFRFLCQGRAHESFYVLMSDNILADSNTIENLVIYSLLSMWLIFDQISCPFV